MLTFRVNDGATNSALAVVTINIAAGPNVAPVASAQSITTAEDTAKAANLSGTDIDGNALTYTVVTPPAHGTLSGTSPNLTYTPATNYNGSDTFWFKANDGALDSELAAVAITVTPVNDAPVASAQTVAATEDTAKSITLSAFDADIDPLTYSIVVSPLHGTLSGGQNHDEAHAGHGGASERRPDRGIDKRRGTGQHTLPERGQQQAETNAQPQVRVVSPGGDAQG